MKKLITLALICIAVNLTAQNYPTSGLVAYYPLNGTGVDRSGNNYDLTASSVTLDKGIMRATDSSALFNGTQSSILSGSYSGFLNTNYTISAWVRLDSLPNTYGNIFELGTSYYLRFLKQGSNNFLIQTGYQNTLSGYSQITKYLSASNLFIGTWHHIAVKRFFEDGGYKLQLFLDGKLIETSDPVQDVIKTTNSTLTIGGRPSTSLLSLQGALQDVFYYNRDLNATEITSLYNYNNTLDSLNYISITDTFYTCGNQTTSISVVGNQKLTVWIRSDSELGEYNYASVDSNFIINDSELIIKNPSLLDSSYYKYFLVKDGYYINDETLIRPFRIFKGEVLSGVLTATNDNNNTLTVNTIAGATSYQLYKNGNRLGNATLDTVFINLPLGIYYVVASNGGCNIQSNPISLFNTGLKIITNNTYKSYPNPASSNLTIEGTTKLENIIIRDMNGSIIKESNDSIIDVSTIKNGLYILEINDNGKTSIQKLMIKNN